MILAILITLLVFAFAATTGFCGMFRWIEGYWPRWHFRLFLKWWWPFRAESAATLAAVALDVDDSCSDWVVCGGYEPSISSAAMKTTISRGYVNENMRLRVDGTDVPLTLWDEQMIYSAWKRWNARRDRVIRAKAKFSSAAIFSAALKEKYHARTQ